MKKSTSSPEMLPYGEIIIRAGDSRPIVVQSAGRSGKVDISPGTWEDAEELELFCRMIAQVARSATVVRKLHAANEALAKNKPLPGDDIPF